MLDLFNFERDFYDEANQLLKSPFSFYKLKMWKNGEVIYDSTKDNLSKLKNKVPKYMKGDYDLSIHGNKIVLVDNIDGTTVEAKCHPDDEFDIGIGIKEALQKLQDKRELRNRKTTNDIQIEDLVQIIDYKKSYIDYPKWLYDKVDFKYVRNYLHNRYPLNGMIGKVIAIGRHDENKNKILIGLQTKNKCVYIVDKEGLKKVMKPNA